MKNETLNFVISITGFAFGMFEARRSDKLSESSLRSCSCNTEITTNLPLFRMEYIITQPVTCAHVGEHVLALKPRAFFAKRS